MIKKTASGEPEELGLTEVLVGKSREDYGATYADDVLQIYRMCVESADKTSARRERANSYFLTLNSALVALAGYLTSVAGPEIPALVHVPVGLAGIVLSYLWYRLIRSYQGLNTAKFKVVHHIEQQLPLRPYNAEWEAVGRGTNPKLYLPVTRIERVVPWVFMVLHTLVAVAALVL